jgi:endo-1,4-beta-xylanase
MHRKSSQVISSIRTCMPAFLLLLGAAAAREGAAAPIAAGASKFLGNTTPGVSSGIPWNFDDYWNQITPENSGKWGRTEPTRDSMSWESLDMSYDHARSKGIVFKQHTFVWNNQQPAWLKELPPVEQREEVEEWIRLFGERYPEADFIDVVNEPVMNPPSFREALGGEGETGWDWVVWSFEQARHYCPNAKLLINEYEIEDNEENLDRYLGIIAVLKERGLIDGIGVQSHWFSIQWTPIETIRSHLDRLAETGLPIYSSEFDLAATDDSTQLAFYKRIFPVFWEHPAIAGVTLWGWIQGRTWNDTSYLFRNDSTERPALKWLREYVEQRANAVRFTIGQPVSPFFVRRTGSETFPNRAQRHPTTGFRLVTLQGRAVAGSPAPSAVQEQFSPPVPANLAPGVYPFLVNDGFATAVGGKFLYTLPMTADKRAEE